MGSRKRGFTLPELLVVIAIIAILAAITFPVLRMVQASATRTVCLSNFRQAQYATTMYLNDYDDRFMPVNYQILAAPTPGQVDRTWVQLLLPYLTIFDIFRCPADVRHRQRTDAVYDIDLMPGDTYGRYYRASLLSNIGYNYLYLSPVSRSPGASQWTIWPRAYFEIADAGSMLLFVDSVSINGTSGQPTGGGSYIVMPPCRRGPNNVDTFGLDPTAKAYAPTLGWLPASPLERYGRAWPWHMGKANMARVAGGVRSVTMAELAAGCNVMPEWGGRIDDTGKYPWDLE